MTGGILGFVLFLVLVPLLVNEAGDIAPWVAGRLLRWGAHCIGPADEAERYEEEWLADLERVPAKLAKLTYACFVLVWTVPRLRRQFRQEVWLSAVLLDRWRTYRFHHAPISDSGNGVGLKIRNSRTLSSDDSLALVQLHNCGRCGIEADDFKLPLSVTFEGRDIIGARLAAFSSPDVEPRILDEPGIKIDGSTVVLPKIPLSRGDSVRMFVLLSGTGRAKDALASLPSYGRRLEDATGIDPVGEVDHDALGVHAERGCHEFGVHGVDQVDQPGAAERPGRDAARVEHVADIGD